MGTLSEKTTKQKWIGDMVQGAEHLPSEQQAPSSNFNTNKKNLSIQK
jgi:hypothetical protein